MAKFHIEGDWYLVTDQYSWNLAKKTKTPQKTKEWAEITYYASPKRALQAYLLIAQEEKARSTEDGTIQDLVDILVTESKRLSATLENVFAEACEWKGEKPCH